MTGMPAFVLRKKDGQVGPLGMTTTCHAIRPVRSGRRRAWFRVLVLRCSAVSPRDEKTKKWQPS